VATKYNRTICVPADDLKRHEFAVANFENNSKPKTEGNRK
jgi:hypothetical protein